MYITMEQPGEGTRLFQSMAPGTRLCLIGGSRCVAAAAEIT